MTIQGQNPVTDPTAQTPSTTTTAATDPTAALANENTFLQLLVAQIQNQDPTNPTDSVQFLSQLAQFSQLEQLIGIRQELQPAASSTGTTDPDERANLGGKILACQQRQSALLGGDVPARLAVMVGGEATDDDETDVRMLREHRGIGVSGQAKELPDAKT